MNNPWAALGISILIFFPALLSVDRFLAISNVLSSPAQGFPKRVARRFTVAGWLAVIASGLVTLGVVLELAWDFLVEHTHNMVNLGAWAGLGWVAVYGIFAVVLNGFGVRVYRDPAGSGGLDGINGSAEPPS